MIYLNEEITAIQAQNIRSMMKQVQQMTQTEKSEKANMNTIIRLLKKILESARQEKEGYLYFDTLYYLICVSRRQSIKESLKYARRFLWAAHNYMEQAVMQYPEKAMKDLNMYFFVAVFHIYKESCEITDKHMEEFMRQFYQTVEKYGNKANYYHSQMRLYTLYRKKDALLQAAKNLKKQNDYEGCIHCMNIPFFIVYVACNDFYGAEQHIEKLMHMKNLCRAQEALGCGRKGWMYRRILDYCIQWGNSELYWKCMEKYLEYYAEDSEGDIHTLDFFHHAVGNSFFMINHALEMARRDIQDEIEWKNTTVGSIHDYLCWWCYFILFDRHGVHTVKTEAFSEFEIEKNGEISCLCLAEYFEKKADFLGKKFEISRKEFDYMFLKQAYCICARI